MDDVPESTELDRSRLKGSASDVMRAGDEVGHFRSSNRSIHSGLLALSLQLDSLLPLDLVLSWSELSELGLRHRR